MERVDCKQEGQTAARIRERSERNKNESRKGEEERRNEIAARSRCLPEISIMSKTFAGEERTEGKGRNSQGSRREWKFFREISSGETTRSISDISFATTYRDWWW